MVAELVKATSSGLIQAYQTLTKARSGGRGGRRGGGRLTQPQALQLLFDVRFISSIMSGRGDNKKVGHNIKKIRFCLFDFFFFLGGGGLFYYVLFCYGCFGRHHYFLEHNSGSCWSIFQIFSLYSCILCTFQLPVLTPIAAVIDIHVSSPYLLLITFWQSQHFYASDP